MIINWLQGLIPMDTCRASFAKLLSPRESREYLVKFEELVSTYGCQCGRTIFDLIARSIANAKVSSEKWRS